MITCPNKLQQAHTGHLLPFSTHPTKYLCLPRPKSAIIFARSAIEPTTSPGQLQLMHISLIDWLAASDLASACLPVASHSAKTFITECDTTCRKFATRYEPLIELHFIIVDVFANRVYSSHKYTQINPHTNTNKHFYLYTFTLSSGIIINVFAPFKRHSSSCFS